MIHMSAYLFSNFSMSIKIIQREGPFLFRILPSSEMHAALKLLKVDKDK